MTRPLITADDIHFGGPEHVFRRAGEGHYRLTVVEHGIELDVERLWRDKHELNGELVVSCGLKGAKTYNGRLFSGHYNLSSMHTRDRLAGYLRTRAQTKDAIDWQGLLEEFCILVADAEREGQPARLLREYGRPSPDDTYEVAGLPILKRHPMMFFGDGGTFKSYLGLYVAGRLALDGVAVLYADWELAGEDHRDRLERLFGADMPGVRYLRCQRPMVAEADSIRRAIEDFGIEYVVCDSVGYASNGAPESAEVATAYFRAVRQFGSIGSLHIAHVTKPKEDDKLTNLKPFGSAFWSNSARSTWFVKRANDATDGSQITIGLYHQKANTGPLRHAVGLQIAFDAEHTQVTPVDLADVAELAATLPLWRRCMNVLRNGAQTTAYLADALDDKGDSVEKALKRSRVFVRLTNTPDGIHRWGLAERRAA